MKFDCIERRLARLFYAHGKLVNNWPVLFVIWPLVLTLILSLGCIWNVKVLADDLSLYTPRNGRAIDERKLLEHNFHLNDSSPFFAERRHSTERMGFIIVQSKLELKNVLSTAIFQEIAQLWLRILDITILDGNGTSFTYEKLCIKSQGGICVQNPLIFMSQLNPQLLAQGGLQYPLTETGTFIGTVLGGVETDAFGNVLQANAMLLPYQLQYAAADADRLADQWEKGLTKFLEKFSSLYISVSFWTSDTMAIEANKDTQKVIQLIGPLIAILTIFTLLCCFEKSLVRSKPLLGLAGMLSASCAVLSAIGLLCFCGVPLTSLAYFMPFVILSIGVDNIFIMFAAWRKTSTYLSVSERMSLTFYDAGVSITVTSLTDVLSFGVGCYTQYRAVQIFCAYATVAIAFVYLYQITLFAAFMSICGRMEAAGRDGLFCYVHKDWAERSKIQKNTVQPQPHGISTCNSNRLQLSSGIEDYMLARWFRGTYTTFITHPAVKVVVLAVFIVYIGLGVYGCTLVVIGLDPVDLLPRSSPARNTLLAQEQYFSNYCDYMSVCFNDLDHDLTYFQTQYWQEIDVQVKRFENTPYSAYSDSWLRLFVSYAAIANIRLDQQNFVYLLKNAFLNQTLYQKYQSDVIINSAGNRILAARFPVRLRNCGFPNQTKAMNFFRQLSDSSKMNISVYHSSFIFADQYNSILPATLTNIGLASAAVILVSLLFIPKPLCSVWVSLTIISINVGIFGYMTFWGVKIDFVSMVTIVMSIGFCVDFSAHIAYQFAKGKHLDSVERVRKSMYLLGIAILQSGISTIIGIAILIVIDNYVYRAFVKTNIIVTVLGIFHGLVILPVLLTITYCGTPASKKSKTGNNLPTVSNRINLPAPYSNGHLDMLKYGQFSSNGSSIYDNYHYRLPHQPYHSTSTTLRDLDLWHLRANQYQMPFDTNNFGFMPNFDLNPRAHFPWSNFQRNGGGAKDVVPYAVGLARMPFESDSNAHDNNSLHQSSAKHQVDRGIFLL